MTAADLENPQSPRISQLGTIISEDEAITPEDSAERVSLSWISAGRVFSNLKAGVNLTVVRPLKANDQLSSRGVMLFGSGFILESSDFGRVENKVLFDYINGRDLLQNSRNVKVIDLFGLSLEQVQTNYPKAYKWVLERVKPERDANRDKALRENWWVFGRPRTELRPALKGLKRYIATVETSKHRVFVFLDASILADNRLIAIALEDAYFLGVLSSKIHVKWSIAAGGSLEDRPVYTKTYCLDRFPFPDSNSEQKQKIRELGEKLDAHRKRVQAQHPNVTITGMYNLLEKLRGGEPFTDSDRTYNDKALVSTLKQIHDDLDSAVFEAYGWQPNISDDEILENLVALNAERAEEERNGLVRWLRPEYQAPGVVQVQQTLTGVMEPEIAAIAPAEQKAWSKQPKEQLTAIQELLSTSQGEWTVEQIAVQFKGGGRSKKAIKENLERLEFFGYAICRTDEMGVIRWQFVEIQKTA